MNALISLIPVFPIWTLFPVIGTEYGIQQLTGDCELAYKIILSLSILIAICIVGLYLFYINKVLLKDIKFIKRNFKLISLLFYTFANAAAMIIILGPHLACYGSSMSIMVVIYSGPIASIAVLIFGFLVDIRLKMMKSHSILL
jgi:hypothetical protein